MRELGGKEGEFMRWRGIGDDFVLCSSGMSTVLAIGFA